MDRSPYEPLVAKPWQKSEIRPFIRAYELQIQKPLIETLGLVIWVLFNLRLLHLRSIGPN